MEACHQRIYPHTGAPLSHGQGFGALQGASCSFRVGRAGEQVMVAGSPLGAATFRRVVAPSGGRLHPMMNVGEDGTELGVDRYWDEVQNMECRLRPTGDGATCSPIAETTRGIWQDSACRGARIRVFYTSFACRPLPRTVLAQREENLGDPPREVEVLPTPPGDYYAIERPPNGRERCVQVPPPVAIMGEYGRTVYPVPLTREIR